MSSPPSLDDGSSKKVRFSGNPPTIASSTSSTSKDTHKSIGTPDLAAVRQTYLHKIVPSSLIPMATANGMLVMGSHKVSGPGQDCDFMLPEYLIWTGTISLSLVVIGVVGRYVLGWILEDKVITSGERKILLFWQVLGILLLSIELLLLIVGSIIVYPRLPSWQYSHKNLPNYCDFGMVVFAAIFLGLAWVFILFGLVCAIYVTCYANRYESPAETYYAEKP